MRVKSARKYFYFLGAGIAGVSAAATLTKAGISNIRIFEASDRWGGRVQNFNLSENISVNLGANWMSGDRNPILKLLRKDETVKIAQDFQVENEVTIFDQNFKDVTETYRK